MEKNYNSKEAEQHAQQKWSHEGTYLAKNNPGPLYSIDTPPPTVSGSLHIGHIFSYTQTDIIARFKRMHGRSVFYPFGFDDNGLPTERFVEKKLDIRAHTMPRSEFIALCLKETHVVEEQFKVLWQGMGLSVDWDSCYSTISDSTRKISQESFIDLYQKGYIYRKYEPALYCTTCRTSVAQAELDDIQKASFFNDIVFQSESGDDLIIGTTRPELLSSCVALLYNPFDERYSSYKEKQAVVPLFGYRVPILEDEHVDMEKGTGLVMCCTFGDKTDIEWYKKFKLPYRQSVGLDGKWTQETGILAGLNFMQAREKILEALKERNLLLRSQPITHAVNVHERCKKEIEYVPLSQWFLNILEHKTKLIELADQIHWYPAFMKARYKNWVENISWDWCLSRQRYFGIPFPVWHCVNCNEILLAKRQSLPVDPQETPANSPCKNCGGSEFKPDTDVMDTWNTSSLTPYLCFEYFKKMEGKQHENQGESFFADPELLNFLPMSMRPQAHDIIRTWAFYTIIKTWMHNDTVPWKDIVISGHVLADSKEKLSKSKDGGKLSPENLLDTYSADAIRYWTASGSLGQDTAFSDNQLKIGQRLTTKLWNAFKFVGEHTGISSQHPPQKLDTTNEWLMHTASITFKQYNNYFEQHEFSLALDTIEKFFWHNFCDNYLELVKNQLFNPHEYEAEQVTATRWTLYTVGIRILQMYAPYMPYITETIYEGVYAQKIGVSSIHQTKFSLLQQEYVFEQSIQTMDKILELIAQVRRLKTENQLSLKTPLTVLSIVAQDSSVLDAIKQEEQILKGVTQAATIVYQVAAGQSPHIAVQDETWSAKVVCP